MSRDLCPINLIMLLNSLMHLSSRPSRTARKMHSEHTLPAAASSASSLFLCKGWSCRAERAQALAPLNILHLLFIYALHTPSPSQPPASDIAYPLHLARPRTRRTAAPDPDRRLDRLASVTASVRTNTSTERERYLLDDTALERAPRLLNTTAYTGIPDPHAVTPYRDRTVTRRDTIPHSMRGATLQPQPLSLLLALVPLLVVRQLLLTHTHHIYIYLLYIIYITYAYYIYIYVCL